MPNLETLLWGFLAAAIRVLKDYIGKKTFSFIFSTLTVLSGTTCAYLFTPFIVKYYGLQPEQQAAVAFITGLVGKDLIELILSVDLSEYIHIDSKGIQIGKSKVNKKP